MNDESADAPNGGPEPSLLDLVEEVPQGFSARIDSHSQVLEIVYARHGMGCMMLFLGVWLAGWTCGGVMALRAVLSHRQPFLLFWLCGWAVGEAIVAYTLLWFLCGRTVVTLAPDRLSLEKVLFGWRRSWSVARDEIRSIAQVQDGGKGEDSFVSYGLRVEAGQPRSVLARQAYEKSEWLGRVLSVWAGVPFAAEPEP